MPEFFEMSTDSLSHARAKVTPLSDGSQVAYYYKEVVLPLKTTRSVKVADAAGSFLLAESPRDLLSSFYTFAAFTVLSFGDSVFILFFTLARVSPSIMLSGGSRLLGAVECKVFFSSGDSADLFSARIVPVIPSAADATVSAQFDATFIHSAHVIPETPPSSGPTISVVAAKPDNEDSVIFSAKSIIIPFLSSADSVF